MVKDATRSLALQKLMMTAAGRPRLSWAAAKVRWLGGGVRRGLLVWARSHHLAGLCNCGNEGEQGWKLGLAGREKGCIGLRSVIFGIHGTANRTPCPVCNSRPQQSGVQCCKSVGWFGRGRGRARARTMDPAMDRHGRQTMMTAETHALGG